MKLVSSKFIFHFNIFSDKLPYMLMKYSIRIPLLWVENVKWANYSSIKLQSNAAIYKCPFTLLCIILPNNFHPTRENYIIIDTIHDRHHMIMIHHTHKKIGACNAFKGVIELNKSRAIRFARERKWVANESLVEKKTSL